MQNIVLSLHIFSYALKSVNNTHDKRAGIYAGKKEKERKKIKIMKWPILIGLSNLADREKKKHKGHYKLLLIQFACGS